jgi:hypothetical protein
MIVVRESPLTGDLNEMDLAVSQEQLDELGSWPRRKIQDIFPDLSPEQREFLLTGYTPKDWGTIFPKGED